jgi:hypothetical protein
MEFLELQTRVLRLQLATLQKQERELEERREAFARLRDVSRPFVLVLLVAVSSLVLAWSRYQDLDDGLGSTAGHWLGKLGRLASVHAPRLTIPNGPSMAEVGKTALDVGGALADFLVPSLIAGLVWLLFRMTTNWIVIRTAGVSLAVILAASFAADGVVFKQWLWHAPSQLPPVIWLYIALCVVVARAVIHDASRMSAMPIPGEHRDRRLREVRARLVRWMSPFEVWLGRTAASAHAALHPLRSPLRRRLFLAVPIAELLALWLLVAWTTTVADGGGPDFGQVVLALYAWGNLALLTLLYIGWCAWCLAVFLTLPHKTSPATSRRRLLVFASTPVVCLASAALAAIPHDDGAAYMAPWYVLALTLILAFLVWSGWAVAVAARLLIVDNRRLYPSTWWSRPLYVTLPWICLVSLVVIMMVAPAEKRLAYLVPVSCLYIVWGLWCLAVVRADVRGSAVVWFGAVVAALVIDVLPAQGDLVLLGTMTILATIGYSWLADAT